MKILVVDDEKDTRTLLRDLLAADGHNVTTAASSVEAMMHVELRRFDLVLLDIMMPGIDGNQFAQFLSSHWSTFDIPIIVVSCRTDAECKSWSRLHGCVGYLEKPFSPAELLDRVMEVDRGIFRSEAGIFRSPLQIPARPHWPRICDPVAPVDAPDGDSVDPGEPPLPTIPCEHPWG